MSADQSLRRLTGILTIESEINILTGLRIGAAESSISIGGVDNPVIRDPLTGQPYLPGSSLKGKLRSLLERRYGLEQNWRISQISIHACDTEAGYQGCRVCQLFGIPAPREDQWFCLTRLRVSDSFLSPESEDRLSSASTDLPYTEVKTEAAIDRVTSAATPRSMERVPAGAVFGPSRISLLRYDGDDSNLLGVLVEGLGLVEADYLGGTGSRGSGRVAFRQLQVGYLSLPEDGDAVRREYGQAFPDVGHFASQLPSLTQWLSD